MPVGHNYAIVVGHLLFPVALIKSLVTDPPPSEKSGDAIKKFVKSMVYFTMSARIFIFGSHIASWVGGGSFEAAKTSYGVR